MPLFCWKFIIADEWVQHPDGSEWKTCIAAAISTTEEGGKEIIRKSCREQGIDYRWLDVAKTHRLDIAEGSKVCLVMQ